MCTGDPARLILTVLHAGRGRERGRTRLREGQRCHQVPVNERDGWLSLDDPDKYDFMACRWPGLRDDVVRAAGCTK